VIEVPHANPPDAAFQSIVLPAYAQSPPAGDFGATAQMAPYGMSPAIPNLPNASAKKKSKAGMIIGVLLALAVFLVLLVVSAISFVSYYGDVRPGPSASSTFTFDTPDASGTSVATAPMGTSEPTYTAPTYTAPTYTAPATTAPTAATTHPTATKTTPTATTPPTTNPPSRDAGADAIRPGRIIRDWIEAGRPLPTLPPLPTVFPFPIPQSPNKQEIEP
jgi:hypothetical protein